uniref:Sec16_C domain-containing protein n=1 Tax=Syphacia muris TaxID=451379 RepID=A0A0N5AIX3_9BILA
MSYSTPLPSTVTPGWNDPPMNLGAKTSGTGVLAQKYRRPIDPSIQVSNKMNSEQSRSAVEVNGYVKPTQNAPAAVMNMGQNGVPNFGAELAQPRQAVYDAFTVPNNYIQQKVPPVNQMMPPPIANDDHVQTGAPMHMNFTSDIDRINMDSASKPPIMNVLPPTAAMPIEANPTALIYTPPNTVNEEFQKVCSLPHPSNFVPPTKAAGDVSLDAKKLAGFLYKATMKLPQSVTRDGIQLRIGHFDQVADLGTLSDPCIKKLNFIVDALDRENYKEANQFFDQFLVAFSEEAKTSWAQGIRLLLQESMNYFGSLQTVHHY